jgi:NADPH:quinone reductase-like Zn-dependent oxidoreductase/thioesterase domain-containing protein/acyl carrier protein
VPRLARVGREEIETLEGRDWRLGIEERGTLENLSLLESSAADQPLEAGQVRVGVRAAGLNFRDVLNALGMFPGIEMPIGGEGAGVVLEAAPDVTDLATGDRVMGVIAGAFAPVGVADRRTLVKMPKGWSFVQAASMPIAFLTAHYALVDLAELQPGEKILVHGAAGGVGMAAVQLARHLGAEVFATAHPDKWEAVRALGVDADHIASSRSLEFRDEFLRATGGAGVNVVLDALAREFVDASLELLPRGGRFVEMGATDIRDPGEVGAAHPGVRYRAFELGEAGLERMQEMLVELVELFEGGALEHLPVKTWDVRQGARAFRHMSQARHVGKVVLTVPAPIDPDSTVLITAGLSGIGALVARHLVEHHGARHLLLVSRRGPEAEGVPELQAELEELGAEVRVEACDVSEREQVRALIESLSLEHPLDAVIHSAAVLDDGPIASFTRDRLERVMEPKLDGAWHLHELTAGLELSHFLMFSSAGGTIGSPGQANYAASNVFLDALAAHRRAENLPAASLAWGGWGLEKSLAGKLDATDTARLGRLGFTPMAPEHGLELFDAALALGEAVPVPVQLNEAGLRAQARAGTLPAVLRGLVRAPARREDQAGSLARRLAGVPQAERRAVVLDAVRAHIAAVLGHASIEEVEPEQAFLEMGFDSLAAIELRNRLNVATGLRLPPTLVFDHPTAAALAGHLASRLDPGDGGGNADPEAAGGSTSEPGGNSGNTFVSLLPQAQAREELDPFIGMIATASTFRPTFDAPPAPGDLPDAIRLATGSESPSLVLLPSMVAAPYQYAKLVKAFDGKQTAVTVPLPGFGAGEALPSSAEVAAKAQAEAVVRADLPEEFVLVGHSSGGWIAHATAGHLERAGASPQAVVLLDSYPPQGDPLPWMRFLFERNGAGQALAFAGDAGLTAMAAYLRIFSEWQPDELSIPTVIIGAEEPTDGLQIDGVGEWRHRWGRIDIAMEVPGNHFTMLDEHAESTAQAVHEALGRLPLAVSDGT